MSDSFISELKRRNVFKVGIAYLVLAWVVIQVTSEAVPALHLPEWVNSLVFYFGAIGFPFALFFSWAYEITADGLKKESEVVRDDSPAALSGRILDFFIIGALIFIIGGMLVERFLFLPQNQPAKATELSAPSIAVLPFSDMSSQGDQEYFGDGIAEELLNVLAKTRGLKVAARTSSFKFKGENVDITEIGNALKVNKVLEGSIRKSGEKVRITAQLINVADGYHIWSESYDRELKNIFQVQDEIAQAIVATLKLELDLEQVKTSSRNIKAYELYLKGRENARQPNKENLLKAVDNYQQAIAIEQDYAEAYAGLASTWSWLEDYGGYTTKQTFPIIEGYARESLLLDSNNAEALMAMGLVQKRINNDPLMALFFFEQALQINPNYVEVFTHIADVLLYFERYDDALFYRKKAVELDPLSTFYRSRLASQLSNFNNMEPALKELEKLFKILPDDVYGLEELSNILTVQGKLAQSITNFSKVHHARPGDPFSAAQIAILYGVLNQSNQSNHWLALSDERGKNNRWALNARAAIALLNGDWQQLLKAAEIKKLDNPDVAASWAGTAYLGLEKLTLAKAQFMTSVLASDLSLKKLKEGQHFSLLGLIKLTQDPLEKALFIEAASNLYHKAIRLGDSGIGNPDFNPFFGLACIKLSQYSSSGKYDKSLKEEALTLLSNAIDSGFRNSQFLNNSPFFAEFKHDPDFQSVTATINKLNQLELAKLESLAQTKLAIREN